MRLTLERLCYGLWITRKNGMVQNQVTIVWFCHRWVQRAFRQAMQLAEGQSADVKHLGALLPLSANSDNWRRGSNFPRKTPLFANFAPHLAEGVEFPEKNADFGVFALVIGGGGLFGLLAGDSLDSG